ncbi:MAG: hypothetical protein I3273_05330 [Candidatus Moeniiplasma glomeromycotorum]|nr:hypothetical protein [Candidatus Moeniiplasma glomeromycotorum]MCE8167996.1 hypothetical protein [Candidatus Moeniiplasma glomeromycotorum]MCE8169511.1 hypothetical protein [Candidatus Moeniiplasma glomeromycotorum]
MTLFFSFSLIYCLISSWFSWEITHQPTALFFHFLSQWCVWISLVTIIFALWRLNRPKTNNYAVQIFSLIVMISNAVMFGMFALSLIVWGITGLTTNWGFTNQTTKIIPLPDCSKAGEVIRWVLYSPFWHLVIPIGFIYYYFCYEEKDLAKKRPKLTFFLCFAQPALYYAYCVLRVKLSPRRFLESPFSRWPLPFFSARQTLGKLGISQYYCLVYKIIVAGFCFGLFGLIGYLTLRFASKLGSNSENQKLKY